MAPSGRDACPPLSVGLIPSCLITALAAGVAAAVTAAGAHSQTGASNGGAALQALARGISVAVPIAVALYACRRAASARFGRALLVFSGVWFLGSLAASSSQVVYSVGRISTWVAEVGLVYVVLAFPSGRLRDRADRAIVAVGVAVTLLLCLTALFVERYPEPSSTSGCYLTCPRNAFMIVGREVVVIRTVIAPLALLAAAVVFVIVAVRLARRIRDANSLLRRTLTPVLIVAIGRIGLLVALALRWAAPGSALVKADGWAVALTVPAFALAFLVGLARWHLFVSAGLRTVNAGMRQMAGPQEARALLASAFDDPGLEIASWSNRRRRWIASTGQPLRPPGVESGRHLTEVREGRRPVVSILHDVELSHDPAFLDAATATASIAFAADRVASRTSALVRELKAARARIVAAGDSERQRIERDLHDGAQQHLVGLAIHLELAAEKAELEQPEDAEAFRGLAAEVDQALEQLRSLTRGVPPTALVQRGLEASVRAAAQRSLVPTTVEVRGLRDYPDEITTAVYFCCLEALQNIAKHAHGARAAHIELREANSTLSFSVSDDGPGIRRGDDRVGAGMINMRDRMTTVGGKLTVQSRPGQGTRISGRVPLAALAGTPKASEEGVASRRARSARRRDHAQP